jgi:molecular chaperone DnaK
MSRIVGIDLGTTNSLVATVDSGVPFVIADADGARLLPSVVHYPAGDAAPITGKKALRLRVLEPERTVYSIKRFMGRRGAVISREEMQVAYPVQGNGGGPVAVNIPGRSLTPEDVSAEILKELKRTAELHFGEPVTRAVITVPAYFNDAQRNATKKAGELAGFTVERILNEPTAAALAYGLERLKESTKVAVYDLGGGTFDLSILELREGVFQVLSTHGDTQLGGDDLDRRLVAWIVEQIKAAGGPDPTVAPPLLARVREVAEQAKIKLSTAETVDVALPFLTPDFSFSVPLTRATLEELTRDIVARTRAHCLRSMADAHVEPSDLGQVILVGGQTRMPLVRRMVAEIFSCASEDASGGKKGPVLNTSQNPDEAVALGAAIQAEILSGGFKNVLLLDVTPLSLGIEVFGGLMNVIIPRNSTIPTKAGEVFTTAIDNQPNVLVHVLQGERERASDNWSLGRFTLDFERAPKGVPRVGVQFEIDADGILHVLARDIKTGRQVVVTMKSAVDVNDADVQKMVEESLEYAFDDLKARQWIETKVRAGEVLVATRKGLAECAAELDAAYRQQVETAMQILEYALATENSKTKIGDIPRLKAASGALDEATKRLADLMMDKAMEALLKKRGLIP